MFFALLLYISSALKGAIPGIYNKLLNSTSPWKRKHQIHVHQHLVTTKQQSHSFSRVLYMSCYRLKINTTFSILILWSLINKKNNSNEYKKSIQIGQALIVVCYLHIMHMYSKPSWTN